MLPDSCEALAEEPEATIGAWLKDVPSSEKVASLDTEVKDIFYILLQRVNNSNVADEDQDEDEFATKVEKDDDKNQSESTEDNVESNAKLQELRLIKKQVVSQNKLSLKFMYHESFFFRILGMLDYYTSLA